MDKRIWTFALALTLSTLSTSTSLAQGGGRYEVTQKAGTWMVLAHTYKGADAKYLAEKHVLYLRQRYRLPAWIVSLEKMRQRYAPPQSNQVSHGWVNVEEGDGPVRRIRIWDECGVLIGGYRDREDARKVAEMLKTKVQSPRLVDRNGKPAYDTFFRWEEGKQKEVPVNVYKTCMVCRNPAIPRTAPGKRDPGKADPRWKKLNRHEEYSLFKNPKDWTIAVQQFHGITAIQGAAESEEGFFKSGGLIDSIKGLWGDGDQRNAYTANQAHELARLLRHYGLKAYVLHTASASVVTVGEFDSPDSPEFHKMQQKLATLRFGGADTAKLQQQYQGVQPLAGPTAALNLFRRPLPMRVPR